MVERDGYSLCDILFWLQSEEEEEVCEGRGIFVKVKGKSGRLGRELGTATRQSRDSHLLSTR
jgi:hypothetical protein